MALYSERIAENQVKIDKLNKNIERDTKRLKKLKAENDRLAYDALCAEYHCSGQALLNILSKQNQTTEEICTADDDVSESDTSADAQDSEDEMSDEEYEALGQLSFETEKRNPYEE